MRAWMVAGLAATALTGHAQQAANSATANELLVEASRLIGSAADARGPEAKIRLLERAEGRLQSLVDRYPSSDLAVRLATGQRIGNISLAGVRSAVKDATAACWNSPSLLCTERLTFEIADALQLDQLDDYGRGQVVEALLVVAAARTKMGDMERAREAWGAAAEAASSMDHELGRAQDLKEVASAQAKARAFADALKTAQAIEDRDWAAYALREVVAAQTEAGSLADALDTASSIEDAETRVRALGIVARGQAEAGRFADAFETAQLIEDTVVRGAALIEIALAQSERGLAEDARSSFAAAREVEAKDAETGRASLARIATAQAQAGFFDDALRTARSIEGAQGRRSLIRIASAEAEAGRDESARSNFAAATAAATAIEAADARASALVDVASAQAAAGQTEDAKSTMAIALEDSVFEAASKGTRIEAAAVLSDIGRREDVEDALHAAVRSILAPGASRRALTFVHIARALGEWGWGVGEERRRALLGVNLVDGREIGATQGAYLQSVVPASGAERAGLRRGDRIVRLDGLAVADKADLYERLRQRRPGDRIMLDFVRDGQQMTVAARMGFNPLSRGVEAVAAAKEAASWIGEADRDEILREVAPVEAKLGRHADAVEDAQRIRGASTQAAALVEIATMQAEAGDLEGARNTAGLAYEAASSVGDVYVRAETLAGVAAAQAEARAREAAKTTLGLALETAESAEPTPDLAFARAHALAAIAAAEGKAGERANARAAAASAAEAARLVPDADRRVHVLLDIIKAQIGQGDFRRARTHIDEAAGVARSIEDAAARARRLAALGSAQIEAKDARKGRETLGTAVDSAEAVEDVWARALELSGVASAQAETGRTEDARKTIAMALATAQTHDHAGVAMINVAGAQAEAGLSEACRATLKEALDDIAPRDYSLQARYLSAIALQQAKCGQPEAAVRTMSLAIAETRLPSEHVSSLVFAFPEGYDGQLIEQAWTALFAALEAAGGCKDCESELGALLDVLAAAGQVEEAARISALAFEVADPRLRDFRAGTFLQTQARLGYGHDALTAAESLESSRAASRFDMYVSVASGAARHGDSDGVARIAIKRALESRESDRNWTLAAGRLASAQVALGLDGEARATLRDALEALKNDSRPLLDLQRMLQFMVRNDWR